MPVIDSQVHAYERNSPSRPWVGFLHGPDSVTGDEMVAAMDAVGVDGALLVSPFALYAFDGSYALDVYAKYPTRFGLIKPVDTTDTTSHTRDSSSQSAVGLKCFISTSQVVINALSNCSKKCSPSKSPIKRKQLILNLVFSRILTKLRLSFKMPSNLT